MILSTVRDRLYGIGEHFLARLLPSLLNAEARRRLDQLVMARWEERASRSNNPLLRCGGKFFSQNDEDGMVLEIFRRLEISTGTFVEIGVGDGLENNSIILLMNNWRGLWIGGEELAVRTEGSRRVRFCREWITPDSIVGTIGRELSILSIDGGGLDLLSLDIDSFDRHVMERILQSGMRPKLLIVEYNAKLPPPIRFSLAPDERWEGATDYMGCSLQSWCDLLVPTGYRLVACNVTGVNAFFVRDDLSVHFSDIPDDIQSLYMPCDYQWFLQVGHKTSPRTIQHFIDRP